MWFQMSFPVLVAQVDKDENETEEKIVRPKREKAFGHAKWQLELIRCRVCLLIACHRHVLTCGVLECGSDLNVVFVCNINILLWGYLGALSTSLLQYMKEWKVWMLLVRHDGYVTFRRHAWPTFWMSSMRSSMDGSKGLDPYPGVTLLFSGQILWIESSGGKWDGQSLACHFYELMQCNICYYTLDPLLHRVFLLMPISLQS